MRPIIRLFIFAMFMLVAASAFAGVDSVAVVSSTPAAASDATVKLTVFAILGIALHWLVDLRKAKAQNVATSPLAYAKDTWISSLISLIICVIVIMAREELAGISYFAMWQGIVVSFIGYAGDSILPIVFGFAKKAGIDIDTDKKQ